MMLCKYYKLWVSIAIASFYLILNLIFLYGLDDSVNYINAWRTMGFKNFLGVLKFLQTLFLNPPPLGSVVLYRPLRVSYTFILTYLSQYIPFLPDLVNALMVGILSYILFKLAENFSFPKPMAMAAIVWFFGCIPTVAMGNVVLVSQFLVIIGLYGALLMYCYSVQSKKIDGIIYSIFIIFVWSFYAESIFIVVAAVGIAGILCLLKRDFKTGIISLLFFLMGILVIALNSSLIGGGPSQFSQLLSGVVLNSDTTGGLVRQGWLNGFLGLMKWYAMLYRSSIFSGILFSVSPYLFFLLLVLFIYLIVAKRNESWFIGIGALICFVIVNPNLAIGTLILMVCLYYWKEYTPLVSMVLAGLLILGPLYLLDIHLTYLLPALLLLIFKTLWKAYEMMRSKYARKAFLMAGILLPLILFSNYLSGAYFSVRVARDNQRIAQQFREVLDKGIVLTNFRHIFDFYMYKNFGKIPKDYKEEAYFTNFVPLYDEKRAVRTKEEFVRWILKNRLRDKPMYFFVVDYDRLPGPPAEFYSPKFLDENIYGKEFVGGHILNVVVPFFDPGFWLAQYFYERKLTNGFVGYPIFPDTKDDIGVEYGLFTKKLFAVYRVFKITFDKKEKPAVIDQNPVLIKPDYYGVNIYLVKGRFLAVPKNSEPFDFENIDKVQASQVYFSYNYGQLKAMIR